MSSRALRNLVAAARLALALSVLGSGCDGTLSEDGPNGPAAAVPPGLRVGVSLSQDHLGAGESLTAIVEATNLGSSEALRDVSILLPVATEYLDLVGGRAQGSDEASEPVITYRNNMINWRIPAIEHGASVHYTVVLNNATRSAFAAYNGILAFARNEQGSLEDNGAIHTALVSGEDGTQPGTVDLRLSQSMVARYVPDKNDIDLYFSVTNDSEAVSANHVRVAGCLDPAVDWADKWNGMNIEETRCFVAGFTRIDPGKEAKVSFRMRLRPGVEIPENYFTRIFTVADEADSNLSNNWIVLATPRVQQ